MPDRQSWISERRFNRLVVAGVSLGFLLVVAGGVAALLAIRENQRHTAWVSHTYQVERHISRFRIMLDRSEAARRALLLSPASKVAVQTFRQSAGELRPALAAIGAATVDNPRQQAAVAAMRPLLGRELDALNRSFALVRAGQAARAVEEFRHPATPGLIRVLRARAEALLAEEDRLLAIRNRAQAWSAGFFVWTLAVSGLLLAGVAAGSIWVILRYTRDLDRSRGALRRLNDDLEGAVRERTADLSRANEEIQRFAYIVSHDLRSPLVNVMGFTAELEQAAKTMRGFIARAEAEAHAPAHLLAEAKLAAEEDLPEAIGFIRASTAKMDRLINAILRLSREGRRPITPERLDLDALADGVVATLRHRIDELGADVAVAHPLPAVTSDRLAVEQVLANLVENALKYLQPGRPGRIRVAGRRQGDRVLVEVADNGRGIEPRDHERIFDLFRRSGAQDQPGEGIGLAHVRALAYRLGGTIAVDSALGEGATFHVNLPAIFSGEGKASP